MQSQRRSTVQELGQFTIEANTLKIRIQLIVNAALMTRDSWP